MPNLTMLGWMFLVWSIVTGVLTLVLIYRSVVGMKEDDQLFLDPAESRRVYKGLCKRVLR